jgi:DNA repair protein RadD
MAWAIQQWKLDYPPFRVCILAHRKELVQQNSEELHAIWPAGDIGVYSAGLKRRDVDCSVTYASIDSIYNKWGEFPPFDVIIVDEAHRIPVKGEGKYRKFIASCKTQNENLRVVGLTATPFRMGSGPICHKDHILHEVCYEADIAELISQGYLCNLRSKIGDVQPDVTSLQKNSGGDYTLKSLAGAVDTPKIVQAAVRSVMGIINAEKRRSIMFFCVDVQHCVDVSMELRKYGLNAPCVTGKTPSKERDSIATQFKQGRIRAICNMNVYTEGFNAKSVDCIVLLRPTLSPGLFMQMVGRGLRLHPKKQDCLILDYAHCIDNHGPVDCLDGGETKLEECAECGDVFSRAVRKCPHCGWEIPKQEIERMEAEERVKRMHEEEAAQRAILGSQPEELKVDDVTIHRHRKPGKPDSLRIQYRCGISQIREWVCLDHGGYAENHARGWWALRFGYEDSTRATVDSALEDLFLPHKLAELTKTITIVRNKKQHAEITDYKLELNNQ